MRVVVIMFGVMRVFVVMFGFVRVVVIMFGFVREVVIMFGFVRVVVFSFVIVVVRVIVVVVATVRVFEHVSVGFFDGALKLSRFFFEFGKSAVLEPFDFFVKIVERPLTFLFG